MDEVARRTEGGLDARGKQEPEEREDLLVVEALTVELGHREIADQVVARVGATLLEHPRQVLLERDGRGDAALPSGVHADDRARPDLELGEVLTRQTEHAADDLRRELEGEPPDQLRVPRADEAAAELV